MLQSSRSTLTLWIAEEDAAAKSNLRIGKLLNRYLLRLRYASQWLLATGIGATRRGGLLALLLLGVLCLGVLATTGFRVARWRSYEQQPQDLAPERYAVYIDGGSSGTRVRVFRYAPPIRPDAYVRLLLPERSQAVEPGLSAHAGDPRGAADSLGPLLDYAYAQVPPVLWAQTPVRLLATAGLRLLPPEQQEDILAACRVRLAASRFLFASPEWAAVIGGELEGLYGWAAVNYITGALQAATSPHLAGRKEAAGAGAGIDPDPAGIAFTGLLEMGGASMQVTFLPEETHAHTHTDSQQQEEQEGLRGAHLPLPGFPPRLYAHSYLGLGMDSALAAAEQHLLDRAQAERDAEGRGAEAAVPVPDPCLPLGFTAEDGRTGNASLAGCMALIAAVLPPRNCSVAGSHSAAVTSDSSGTSRLLQRSSAAVSSSSQTIPVSCILAGAHLPPLAGRFVAVENFAWTAAALRLPPGASLRELAAAGEAHCGRHWASLHAEFSGHIPDQYLVRYCFGAAYTLALLHGGLGLGLDERRLTWANALPYAGPGGGSGEGGPGEPVGLHWVLGAAVVDAMAEAEEEREKGRKGGGERGKLRVLIVVGVLGVIGVVVWVLRRGRPGVEEGVAGDGGGGGGSGGGERGLGRASTAWSSSALSAPGGGAAPAPAVDSLSRLASVSDAGAAVHDPGIGTQMSNSRGAHEGPAMLRAAAALGAAVRRNPSFTSLMMSQLEAMVGRQSSGVAGSGSNSSSRLRTE